jgi:hypothetical protein
MKLDKVERTYTVTKEELEELLNIKISSMYCHDVSGGHSRPSYNLTITATESI